MTQTFEKSFLITEVNELAHTVTGVAGSEALDSDLEICDWDALKAAARQWTGYSERATAGSGATVSRGNIRYMHQSEVAGKAIKSEFDEKKKQWILTSEPTAKYWPLIKDGFLTAYSIGGSKAWTRQEGDYTRYAPILAEVSYVDRGANPDAVFTLIRADGRSEIRKFQKQGDDMTRNDHLECAKRNLAMAEHHEALGKLHRQANTHHTQMAAAGGAGTGADGKAAGAPQVTKSYSEDGSRDSSGGILSAFGH
jgi:hypothetical protein